MVDTADMDERLVVLYEDHHDALEAYCSRRISPAAVPDAVSEVFLTAWRRIRDIPEGSELPWLYGVARNVIRNHNRGLRRRLRLDAALFAQPKADALEADVHVVRRADDRVVLDALATLSQADQEILRLRAWEELPSAEIGIVLGVTSSAVDMRLTRAKRRLEKALKAAGYFEFMSSPRTIRKGGSP